MYSNGCSGEINNESGAQRKNETRTLASKGRRLLGSRVDGVLLNKIKKWEYVVVEGSQDLSHGEQDAKHLHDHFKLARTLQDILRSLHRQFGSDIATRQKVQVFGTLEQGTHWSVYGLQQFGYISCLRNHEQCDVSCYKDDCLSTILQALKIAARVHRFISCMHATLKGLPWQDSTVNVNRMFPCAPTPKGGP